MTKRLPELPDIEDATLRAFLAPLVEAMTSAVGPAGKGVPAEPRPEPVRPFARSNDNDIPPAAADAGPAIGAPRITDWRSATDGDAGIFRTIELFLAMTEAELDAVARTFPRQIDGTLRRIIHVREHLSAQYDLVTTVATLLERALLRAGAPSEDGPGTNAH